MPSTPNNGKRYRSDAGAEAGKPAQWKIYIESTECQGSTVRIILPKEKEQFKNFTLSVKDKKTFYEPDVPTVPLKLAGELRTEDNDKLHRILIVEDNDELRNYLFQSFSPIYNVQVCNNGKEALTIVNNSGRD